MDPSEIFADFEKRRLKMKGGPIAITWMRFPGIRLVEQTEQKFPHIQVSKKGIISKGNKL